MQTRRLLTHLTTTSRAVRRCFPPDALLAITQAIRSAESAHGGEICVVVEAALPTRQLLQGQSARARAMEVFALHHVWDTEHNNGVLIYLLLADRAVEIVADRHIHGQVGNATWLLIAQQMQQAFASQQYADGVLTGVRAVAAQLALHFPLRDHAGNDLPDEPALI